MASKALSKSTFLPNTIRKGPCAKSTPSNEVEPSFFFFSSSLHPLAEYRGSGFSHLTKHCPLTPTLNYFLLSSLLPRVTPWPGHHPDPRAFYGPICFNLLLCLATSCAERMTWLKKKKKSFQMGKFFHFKLAQGQKIDGLWFCR